MSERELETVPADPSDSELLAMFANTICPALSEFLVDYGASAAHWADAARQLREIAAKLAAAEARAVRCEGALRAIGKITDLPGEHPPEKIVEQVKGLRENFNRICERLQGAVQRHHLGLGGEHIDELVVEALDEDAAIFRWLLGEDGEFPESAPGKRYAFRTELRQRLGGRA